MANILIVDDNEDVLGTVGRALTREGYEVSLAHSADEAWKNIQIEIPDLIILDIVMPFKTGLEFCEELRANEQYASIPILFLSARWRTDDIVIGLDGGGDERHLDVLSALLLLLPVLADRRLVTMSALFFWGITCRSFHP